VIFDLGGVVIEWNPDRILEGYYADPQIRAIMKTALFQHPDWSGAGSWDAEGSRSC